MGENPWSSGESQWIYECLNFQINMHRQGQNKGQPEIPPGISGAFLRLRRKSAIGGPL